MRQLAKQLASTGAAALLTLGGLSGMPSAMASEFDLVNSPTPVNSFSIDDAGVLSKATRGELNQRLGKLQGETGYRLEVVTVRKLEVETDAFAFADKVLETWYPTAEKGDKKGLLVVVTTGKEGAVTGGPSFMKKIGEGLLDSIINDNIPIYTEEEKYNQTVLSVVERIEAALKGLPIPDAPQREDTTRRRTYLTKAETEKNKPFNGSVVFILLTIAVIVPMIQFYITIRE